MEQIMTTCIDTDDILLVKNDIGSQIAVTITRNDTNAPVDLNNTDVFFKVSKFGTKTILFTVTADAGTEVSRQAGLAVFTFSQENLNQTPGRYQGEVEMRFPSGGIETVFELFFITLRDDID